MASKALLIILSLALIAVVSASYTAEVVEHDNELAPTVEELEEYFNFRAMEKRGRKKFGCKSIFH